MRSKAISLLIGAVLSFWCSTTAVAQSEGAKWIAVPSATENGYGVYYFRKTVDLPSLHGKYEVDVTGDNRYKFFVNGQLVSIGPARSDARHWNYERVDITRFLKVGKNVLAAVVWNDGKDRPLANMSAGRTGFLLRGVGQQSQAFNTDARWLCIQDTGYQPKTFVSHDYYVAGPGETVDMNKKIADWQTADCPETGWKAAKELANFQAYEEECDFWMDWGWQLMRSELPQREITEEGPFVVRLNSITGKRSTKETFSGIDVPHNTRARLILDLRHNTNAYPRLNFSKGKNATIVLKYAESLYTRYPHKGNRDEVEGKTFEGRSDSIISNGKDNQLFVPLEWRTYRYVVMDIETHDEPLKIVGLKSYFTGFPFRLKASLQTTDPLLNRMMEIGWRTARLCAVESYADCPYYEQLQYLGDTRIQVLVSLYNAGDERLVKRYYNMADWSRMPEGVTQSRYPSAQLQYIQPYALHYIYSLHDYMMYGSDLDFLKGKLMGERTILEYFHRFQGDDGRLRRLPGWRFTDWVYNQDNWHYGVARNGEDGCSAVLDLQLLYAYQIAAELERQLGSETIAQKYSQRAKQLQQTIEEKYWVEDRGIYADRSDKPCFSQHANALAILTGTAQGEKARLIAQRIESDTTLAPASIYFKYYTHRAMVKAGLGDHYTQWLGIWKQYIHLGLTTWGETSDTDCTRSDCHAWGSSPNIEFFRTLLGIDSDAPAFSHVRIEPHLGDIRKIGGTMPHPKGSITVDYRKKGKTLVAGISLPPSVSGTFVWQGRQYELHAGENHLVAQSSNLNTGK